MDFTIVQKAGLSQSELAQILGVTPLTAHKYCAGKSRPHRYIEAHVDRVLTAIGDLVARGKLPKNIAFNDPSRGIMLGKVKAAIERFIEREYEPS